MSWLSELFGGGGDGGAAAAAEQERIRAAQAAAATTEQARQKAVDDFAAQQARTAATGNARTEGFQYFMDRGLNPDTYANDIDSLIAQRLGSAGPNDPAPGQYLTDIGQSVWNNKQNASRESAIRGVNQNFAPDFERQRFGDTFDDPYIAEAAKGQRDTADSYITNLLKRGVVTQTGATGATEALNKQDPRVRDQLDQLGQGVLASGRQSLADVGNRARTAASTLDLGSTPFDINRYTGEADAAYNDFTSKFGDKFKSLIPDNLYDTSGLASAAGIAQGQQNTAFDPNALAGFMSQDQQPTEEDPTNPLKKKKSLF